MAKSFNSTSKKLITHKMEFLINAIVQINERIMKLFLAVNHETLFTDILKHT